MKVKSEIVSRIRKLLNHHDGCLKVKSENEAHVAMDLARKLMDEHHLDIMCVSESCEDEDDISEKIVDRFDVHTVPLWLYNVICTVNNVCNCTCIIQRTGDCGFSVNFVGLKKDVVDIVELYNFLKCSTKTLADKHKRKKRGNKMAWKSFAEGFTSRLLERSVEYCERVDNVDVCTTTDLQLYDYLNNIKRKINRYVDRMKNVTSEKTVMKSRILNDSYESGREQAENQELSLKTKNKKIGVRNV